MTAQATTAVALRDAPKPIVVDRARPLEERDIEIMRVIASTVIEAGGMVPENIKTEAQALAVMFAGAELGLPPMTSLRRVFIVNGKTDFDAQIQMGLVQAADPTGQFIFHRYDAQGCDVELRRQGRAPVRVAYTVEDATKSGQLKVKARKRYAPADWLKNEKTGKSYLRQGARPIGEDPGADGPWQLYPRDMYAWAAIKRCCRLGASDCINGLPVRTVADIIDAPEWHTNPQLQAPGDDGPIPPVIQAIAEGVVVDTETGEILAEQEAAATEPGEESPEPEPAADDDHLARSLRAFKDISESWDSPSVQSLVIAVWKKWPASRKDEQVHLELVGPADLAALDEYLNDVQMNGHQ